MVIAIDGPAGTGKSTIAEIIAKKLGVVYLNSGSFYRALTLALLEAEKDLENSDAIVSFCRQQQLDYRDSRLVLNGRDVEDLLHSDAVSAHVAQISAIPELRHVVNQRMHEITKSRSIVCEGRDMTTVVFPDAEYKFYLDASVDVQAQRRFNQGVSSLSLEQIRENIIKRDEIDKNKKEGALLVADDAFYIDTSHLTIEQVCAIILNKIQV
ncbi:MAG: (d)CMP kinase [Treponema sp.]|jgi:cytidylate kinase|nr:(d)CMP kinase [Treponema sp.]